MTHGERERERERNSNGERGRAGERERNSNDERGRNNHTRAVLAAVLAVGAACSRAPVEPEPHTGEPVVQPVAVEPGATPGELAGPAGAGVSAPKPVAGQPAGQPAAQDAGQLAWRWQTRPDDAELPPARDAHGPGGARFQFEATRDPDRVVVRRVQIGPGIEASGRRVVAWTREFPPLFGDGGELLYQQSKSRARVLLAHYSPIATGCTVHALDADTGEILWTTELQGLGEVSHSKYRNRVQMQLSGGALAVYGWEAQGRYVELVDIETGKTLANARVSEAVAAIAWSWSTPPRTSFRAGPTTVSRRGGGSYTYTPGVDGDSAEVVRARADGGVVWTAQVPGKGKCGNAAMAGHGGVLYAAHYCSISTGAQLMALDETSGAVLWQVALEALPGVGHSEYWNDVEVRVVRGVVVVYGSEAAGRYIEARDPQTGALVSSQVFWS